MIKRLLVLLGVLSIGLSCQASTLIERTKVFNETMDVCRAYHTKCTIGVIQNDRLLANTYEGGRILVSTGMLETMDEKQLRSVIFHEVGHVVMHHVENTKGYIQACKYSNSCNQEFIYQMMRSYELKADRFSVLLTKKLGKPEGLSEALIIITPPKYLFTTSNTHPSTAARVRIIKRIMEEVK